MAFRGTKHSKGPGGAGGAFTLLEVLITLALIGLLAGLVAGGATALLRERPVTGEEIFRSVMSKARRRAVETMHEVRLSYVLKEKLFKLSSVDGDQTVPADIKGDLQVDFLKQQKDGSMLLGGDLVETGSLPFVVFYPDGACTPFRVQLRTGGPARVISIDPWTCLPILENK